MSTSKVTYTVAPASSIKMLRAMVGIGILCALMIVLTFEGTLPRIERNKAEALDKAVIKVLPGMVKKTTYQFDQNNQFITARGEDTKENLVYAGFDEDDKLVGVAIEASGLGYADIIRILYGYDPEMKQVVGFYVLESKETPGLGDKIEKDPDFLANFQSLDVSLTEDNSAVKNKIVPVKSGAKENSWEVEGITGATISSRAIGNIIGTSTEYWVPLIYNNQAAFKMEYSNAE